MQPTTRPQPTTPAMVSSFMQFCNDTTKPFGDRYCEISVVAHWVSYDFMQTKAMSIGFSFASCCASVRCSARTLAVNSGTSRICEMRSPLDAHGFDVRWPGIDEGDVLARLRHMRAGIAADRAGAHDRDLVTHGFLPSQHERAADRRAMGTTVAADAALSSRGVGQTGMPQARTTPAVNETKRSDGGGLKAADNGWYAP